MRQIGDESLATNHRLRHNILMSNAVHQVDIREDATIDGSYTVKVHTNAGHTGRSVLWTPNKREAWNLAQSYEGAAIYYKRGMSTENETRLLLRAAGQNNG